MAHTDNPTAHQQVYGSPRMLDGLFDNPITPQEEQDLVRLESPLNLGKLLSHYVPGYNGSYAHDRELTPYINGAKVAIHRLLPLLASREEEVKKLQDELSQAKDSYTIMKNSADYRGKEIKRLREESDREMEAFGEFLKSNCRLFDSCDDWIYDSGNISGSRHTTAQLLAEFRRSQAGEQKGADNE